MRLSVIPVILGLASVLAGCASSPAPTPEQKRVQGFANAVSSKNWRRVFELIDQGVDPNTVRGYAIRQAARAGDLDVVRRLVAKGADPTRRGSNGTTAAINARLADHKTVAAFLKERDAVVDFGSAEDLAYFIKKTPDYRHDLTRRTPLRYDELRSKQWKSKLVQLKRESDRRWIERLLAAPQNRARYAKLKGYEVSKTTRAAFLNDFKDVRPGAVGILQVVSATKLAKKQSTWLYGIGFDLINAAERAAMKQQKRRRSKIRVKNGRAIEATIFSPNAFVGPKRLYYATFTDGVLTKLSETDYYSRAWRIRRVLVPLDTL